MQLSLFGIKGKTLNWIRDYLSQTTQRVRVNDKFSSSTLVLSGVSQGSVLGPALFLIFVAGIATLIQRLLLVELEKDNFLTRRKFLGFIQMSECLNFELYKM